MSILSRIFFTEAQKLIKISETELINANHKIDMPEWISAYKSDWNESVIDWSSGLSLYKTLFKASSKLILLCVLMQIIGSAFSFSTPILINKFITTLQLLNSGQIQWTDSNMLKMIFLALGLGLCGAGNGLFIQHYFYRTLNFFQISNNIVNKKIYFHALKITNLTKQKNQVGEIVNLMSSDAEAIGDIAQTTIDLTNAAVLLIGCSALLFYYIGWSALVAIVVMIILVPMTQYLVKNFTALESALMKYRDQRMTIMTQVLNAIRVVKYFSWEKSIAEEVGAVRSQEIASRVKLYKAEVLSGLIYTSISTVVLFTALLTHHLRGYEINLAIVLTCISIFATMEDQFGGLSRFISKFTNIFVSANRITQFLKSETVDLHMTDLHTKANSDQNKIIISGLNFSYSSADDQKENKNEIQKYIFSNLNLNVLKNESIALVGAVGTGKSTLLQLILGEVSFQKGSVLIPDHWKLAYQSQEPFILNATLKDNIIFGAANFTNQDLDRAIQLSCLESDINLFPNGLDTEIGEKGVNLSGGQKQRVCLARCILSNADLILMDDPLSAVDIHTESKLCSELIFKYWKNKTRIMVTHRIAHLEKFDRILFLYDNKYQVGTYQDLLSGCLEFRNFIEIENINKKSESEIVLSETNTKTVQLVSDSSRVTVDEDRAVGQIEKSVYKSYISALGGQSRFKKWCIFFLFLSAVMGVMAPLFQRLWLTKYSGHMEAQLLIYGYGFFGLFTMVIYYLNNMFWMKQGLSAGQQFHDQALESILKTDIRFFDSTPIGRILQRFSRDVESVDVHIQWTFEQTINSFLEVSMSFLLIIITLPITIIFLIPVLIYYYSIQKIYRRVAREAKRFDSLARSPRYAHFKESLQGLNVIRAFKKEDYFKKDFLIKLQNSTQAFYTHIIINRWFSTRLPLIGACISSVTVLAIVYSSYHQWISAAVAGLITLYALQFWRYLNWGIRIFSDLESRMTSVERLHFYSELNPETEYSAADQNLKPQSGKLTFKNVRLKYADHLPYVLKNVSFNIESGSKVGIIGRTGSGKSTLFQAVYRFTQFDQGDILIDDRSIRDYTLPNLRHALAVIPQDPSLFMGTLRSNLDRYSEKTDQEINIVLEKIGTLNFIRNLPGQLNFLVAENGSNMSQGQRQLICLARAMLMQVKIIFLDEATASVDVETDALIQKVIRESMTGITLVTIAHRLSTLKGYDKIIELDNGQVI